MREVKACLVDHSAQRNRTWFRSMRCASLAYPNQILAFGSLRHISKGGTWLDEDGVRRGAGTLLRVLYREPVMAKFLEKLEQNPQGDKKPRVGRYHFYTDLLADAGDDEGLCLIMEKDGRLQTYTIKRLARGVGYDVFGNCKYSLAADEIVVEFEQMGREASVLHDCSAQCTLAKVGGEWQFEHAADSRFVLNSFSFCRNHGGQFDAENADEEEMEEEKI